MLGQLVPQGGGDPIPLLKPKLLIGRRDSCDITLRFPNVSSHHCELEFRNGYWLIRDLGSSNGTRVNGVRVEEKFALPGDEVSVAKHRFKVDYEALGEAPPEADEDVLTRSLMDRVNDLDRNGPTRMPSLLEKAGLAGRSSQRRKSLSQESGSRNAKADKTEEEAMKWLEGE